MSDALTFAVRPVGDRSVLLELESNATVHAVAAIARERFGDQLVEVVPGHRTLLLVCREGSAVPDFSELATAARAPTADGLRHYAAGSPQATVISIPVHYDGEDLMAVAQALAVSRERVIELHCAPLYTVAFMGFAPGFPYLVGLPPELQLPRLEVPRLEVPAGSVAVAAEYCGIYPRASPGGWNLLGHTDAVLFRPDRDPPALLAPGTTVRFEPRETLTP
jgi:KipI family sensor histidine kinase inhibitor